MNRSHKKIIIWALFLVPIVLLSATILTIMPIKPSKRDYSQFTETGINEDNHLTLFFIPSPYGINWDNPQKLFFSIARNYFSMQENFMGHVQVEVKCSSKNIHFFTGMRAENLNAKELIFSKKIGLGVIYHKFPGHLEGEEDKGLMIARLKKETGEKRTVNFITFKLNTDQCQRLQDYYTAFKTHELYRYYALISRPLYGEGAGCSAFGVSFLEVLEGLNEEFKKSWSYHLSVPQSLTGAPLYQHQVSPFLFLRKSAQQWGSEIDPEIFFWEPDKMYRWVKMMIEDKTYPVIHAHKTQGIMIDLSKDKNSSKDFFQESNNPLFDELKDLNKNLIR